MKATTEMVWCAGGTYLFDRGYFAFDRLTVWLNAGTHFVIRFKDGVDFKIIERHLIPEFKLPAGIRALTSDWTIVLPGRRPPLASGQLPTHGRQIDPRPHRSARVDRVIGSPIVQRAMDDRKLVAMA
jgi:hypothetical protein